jgi:hypothetical protein
LGSPDTDDAFSGNPRRSPVRSSRRIEATIGSIAALADPCPTLQRTSLGSNVARRQDADIARSTRPILTSAAMTP